MMVNGNQSLIVPTRPVLIVLHQEQSTPGRIGRLLVERGYNLDIRRPRYGDALPSTLEGHTGAMIFGGPMSANDPDGWIRQEIDWISVPLREEVPFLGVCLGAQMLAMQLGSTVAPLCCGTAEIGYWPLAATQEGRSLGEWPSHVYHWHKEGFRLPAGAVRLAEGQLFENQAMRCGRNAYGIQFHPEVTHWMMHRWTMNDDKICVPGGQDRVTQLAGWYQHDGAVRRWLDGFLDIWLSGAKHAKCPALA